MERKHVIHVQFDRHWTVTYDGQSYGPYECKDDAVALARTWAENAAKQGHSVQVVVHEADGPAFNLLNVEPPLESPPNPRPAA
jgi:hypothetical protein